MTTLIQQRSDDDCALASMAMALGAQTWDEVWTEADLEKTIKDNGVGDCTPWLERHGLFNRKHYRQAYVQEGYQESLRVMLWRRRALISVHSLNMPDGNHMVYWDGQTVFDPSPKRTYAQLNSMIMVRVIVFDDTVPPGPCIAAVPVPETTP